jgi:phage-related holin
MNKHIIKISGHITERLIQYGTSIAGGFLMAFEASVIYWSMCFLVILLDVLSAYFLSRRLHKKDPVKYDGKFKSEYKYRILTTMIVMLIAIMLAHFVDVLIIKESDMAERFVVGFFVFYQLWSVCENWSSENNNKFAKLLQKIMINKAERHFNVDLSDLKNNKENENK